MSTSYSTTLTMMLRMTKMTIMMLMMPIVRMKMIVIPFPSLIYSSSPNQKTFKQIITGLSSRSLVFWQKFLFWSSFDNVSVFLRPPSQSRSKCQVSFIQIFVGTDLQKVWAARSGSSSDVIFWQYPGISDFAALRILRNFLRPENL